MTPLRRAVFLDRDGVLNQPIVRDGKPFAPRRLEDFVLYPCAADSVQRLKAGGYLTIVVTNQRDVKDGVLRRSDLDQMHAQLIAATGLDAVYVCTQGDLSFYYKPNPGLLLQASQEWQIDLAASFMVGDRWRDIGAGRRAGCRTLFIDRDYAEDLRDAPDWTVSDIAEATQVILSCTTAE